MNGGNLRLGGGDGHGGGGIRFFDLAVHPLYHGLIVPGLGFEKLNKLFGADVIGKGPQPLTRSAGKQDNIHRFLLILKPQGRVMTPPCEIAYRSARMGLLRKSS